MTQQLFQMENPMASLTDVSPYWNTNTPVIQNNQNSIIPGSGVLRLDGSSGNSSAPPENLNWFNGDSLTGNIGTGVNLAGGALSLAQMIQGLGQSRKAFDLNRKNLKEQMSQRRTAFDRSLARQDRTTAAIDSANAAVKGANPQYG